MGFGPDIVQSGVVERMGKQGFGRVIEGEGHPLPGLSGALCVAGQHSIGRPPELHDPPGDSWRIPPTAVIERIRFVDRLSADELKSMNDFEIKSHGRFE